MTPADLKQIDPNDPVSAATLNAEVTKATGQYGRNFNPAFSLDDARLVTDRVREIIGECANQMMCLEIEQFGTHASHVWLTETPAEITLAALLALAKWREENAE